MKHNVPSRFTPGLCHFGVFLTHKLFIYLKGGGERGGKRRKEKRKIGLKKSQMTSRVLSGYKDHQTQEDLPASSRDQGSSLSSPRQNQIGNIHNEG